MWLPEANPTFRNDLGPCGVIFPKYEPVACHGDLIQVQIPKYKSRVNVYSEMSTSSWIFAPLVGAWREDTLIQRSVSNASIYKPGGMGGLSSTRDTISFDFPARKLPALGKAFIGDYLYGYVCRLPIHHYGWRRPSVASTTVGGRLRRPLTVVKSIMVDGRAANIAIQVIPDENHPQ